MGCCKRVGQGAALLVVVLAVFLARFLQTPIVKWEHFADKDTYYETIHNVVRYSIVPVRGTGHGDVDLEVWTAGPTTGQPLLFVHGFPENGLTGWKHQIPFFAAKGYHVISPNMRGYNISLPHSRDWTSCNPIAASSDLKFLLSHFKYKSAVVIGHDWGASIAYAFAKFYPEQVDRLAILQIPHPEVFKRFFLTTTQAFSSWYMFMFQVPVLAEKFIMKENFSFLYQWAFGTSHPLAFSKVDLQKLKGAWLATNETLSAMLGYYRWIPTQLFNEAEPNIPASMPYLFIYGNQDAYVDARMVAPTIDNHAPHGRSVVLPGSHWIQHDLPDAVNHHLFDFISNQK